MTRGFLVNAPRPGYTSSVTLWARYTVSLVLLVTLSGVPAAAAACELLCPAVGMGSEGAKHHAHATLASTQASGHHEHSAGHHEMRPHATTSTTAFEAIPVDPACCAHSVAALPASWTAFRSDRGPILTDAVAVLIETDSAAPISREAAPGHRPPISPPTPIRAPLVLRI